MASVGFKNESSKSVDECLSHIFPYCYTQFEEKEIRVQSFLPLASQ